MVDTVRILRMGRPTLATDNSLIVTAAAKEVVYEGKAHVHKSRGSGVTVIGEVDIDTRSTVVDIPWDAPVPRQDDVVVVDTSSDTEMVSKALQVRDVDAGGLIHDRRVLTCTSFAESSEWEA